MTPEYRAACHTCHATMRGDTPDALRECPDCGARHGALSVEAPYLYADGSYGYSVWAEEEGEPEDYGADPEAVASALSDVRSAICDLQSVADTLARA